MTISTDFPLSIVDHLLSRGIQACESVLLKLLVQASRLSVVIVALPTVYCCEDGRQVGIQNFNTLKYDVRCRTFCVNAGCTFSAPLDFRICGTP
jgi:hypothetical protein